MDGIRLNSLKRNRSDSANAIMAQRMAKANGASAKPSLHAAHSTEVDSDIARRRRDEIVSAATEIIGSEGIHRLSLARIEERIGMSRGQLTYYFPAKETILLAVFDRMLARMIEDSMAEAERSGVSRPGQGSVFERVRFGLARMLNSDGADKAELLALIHTFMAQIGHRDDYRQKLAAANAEWRGMMADDIAASTADSPNVDATARSRIVASIVMAMFQGLGGQLSVDPKAFDRELMLATLLEMLAPLLTNPPADGPGTP